MNSGSVDHMRLERKWLSLSGKGASTCFNAICHTFSTLAAIYHSTCCDMWIGYKGRNDPPLGRRLVLCPVFGKETMLPRRSLALITIFVQHGSFHIT